MTIAAEKSLAEKEHADRAWGLRQVFKRPEKLAEFLHQSYRATAKSFKVPGPRHHNHGWAACYGAAKRYFVRHATWLMTDYPAQNGKGLKAELVPANFAACDLTVEQVAGVRKAIEWVTGYAGPDTAGVFGELLIALERRIAGEYEWYPVTKRPPVRRPLELTGPSGYVPPNERFLISGYYDPEYRPLSPWLDSTSTCLSDSGFEPTHWRYLTPPPPQEKI